MTALPAAPAMENLCSPSLFSVWEIKMMCREWRKGCKPSPTATGLMFTHSASHSVPAGDAEEEPGGFAGGSLGF